MSEQPDDADRRVVKKVVKKTVIRPVAPAVPRKAGAPVAKSGESSLAPRLVTPARARVAAPPEPAPVEPVTTPLESVAVPTVEPIETAPPAPVRRPAGAPKSTVQPVAAPVETKPVEAKSAPVEPETKPVDAKSAPVEPIESKRSAPLRRGAGASASTGSTTAAPVKVKKERHRPSLPSISLPSLPRPDIRGRASDVGHGIGGFFGTVLRLIGAFFRGIGRRIAGAGRWLIGLRLPHLSPVRGSGITGLVVGLMAVAMGWGFYELFSATLGTQAGGGWGFLAFVFLSFVVFFVGELLLAGFGVEHGRVISILAVLLVLLLILVFFIKLAAGIWAVLIVPTLCTLMFMASSFVVITVSQEKNDQRLPWEPTDESQVNTD